MPRVGTIGHRFPDAAVEAAALAGTGVEIVWLGSLTKPDAVTAASDLDGVLLGAMFTLDADALERLARCRVVVRYGVGVDNVDLVAAARLGMTVCNVPDYGVEEVANHTLALLLLFARRLDVWASAVRTGEWSRTISSIHLHRLSRATLGVLGTGRIGRAVIERARPIWGRILAYDPVVDPAAIRDIGATAAALDEVLTTSDFVTVHVPSTTQTRGLLSAERLQRLKPGAVLVNCSRGDVVDERALADALRAGRIAGAGLDVFAVEPPPADGIIALPNVWPTPHVAWLSDAAIVDLRHRAAEEAGRVLRGEAPRYAVAAPA